MIPLPMIAQNPVRDSVHLVMQLLQRLHAAELAKIDRKIHHLKTLSTLVDVLPPKLIREAIVHIRES